MAAPTEKEDSVANFQTFAAEGDNLYKQCLFQKAVEAYSKVFYTH
jgi:hypothetical protein